MLDVQDLVGLCRVEASLGEWEAAEGICMTHGFSFLVLNGVLGPGQENEPT